MFTFGRIVVLFWVGLLAIALGCNESETSNGSFNSDMRISNLDMSISATGGTEVVSSGDSAVELDLSIMDAEPSVDTGASNRDAASEIDLSMPVQACNVTNDCPFPMVCDVGECLNTIPCTADADCTEVGYICNPYRMQCVTACRVTSQCMDPNTVCLYYKCLPGTRCSMDSDCNPNEECERELFPGRCVEREEEETPDMGVAPDGGIWTCEGSQCSARQRCGPHPSSQCEQQTCLGAHGGQCNDQCDCVPPLICRQNTNKCVECLNSLQCDSPDICIATGQCGVRVDLDAADNALPQNLLILQTLLECSQRESSGGCAEFLWTENAPQIGALRREGCDDDTYSGYNVDRANIQDLLRCGDQDSPLFIDPDFSGVETSGMVCLTRHRDLFWFHNCRAAAVPID